MSTDPVVKTIATYNLIADHYVSQMDAFTPKEERELFLSGCKPYSKILDVGCAAGRDSVFFSKFGHTTVGIDLSEKLLAIARKKAPDLVFIHGDIRESIFPQGSFDAIWACAVLLHQRRSDIPSILKIFHDILVPSGVLYIRVKEGVGEGDVVEKLSKDQGRHFIYFKLDELKLLVEAAGFEIKKSLRSNEKDIDPNLRDLWWITIIAKKGVYI